MYAASKAELNHSHERLPGEMADFNVRVNCIAPGPIPLIY